MGGDRDLFEHAGVPLLVLAVDGGAVVDANSRALDWLAHSAVDAGSTFEFSLPLRRA